MSEIPAVASSSSPSCGAFPGSGDAAPFTANLALRAHNTFGFDVRARLGVVVRDAASLPVLLADPRVRGLRRFVLGGGSNIVFTGDFDGLILRMGIAGRRVVAREAHRVLIEAGAGENWHDFVAWTLDQGFPGLENLALIPGTVGASPVQNIGAYGLELADRFHALRAYDTETGTFQDFDAARCGFGYRDSVFKREGRDRYIITAVTFALPRPWRARDTYADIARQLARDGTHAGAGTAAPRQPPTPRAIFDAVVRVRRDKLPDPALTGNAGSFFKNPVVTAAHHALLREREPDLVAYPQADGAFKLAAGWMIDRCGWKGRALGAAAVHARQALVLVNPGTARGADVLALAQAIARDVERRFGVTLEMEPSIV
ncbi:UDP-N-acetylmuramate dehydrogenase [Robbsia sp. Bb-Pol-6]|uniref:UDP-N-acetylenolpyruvoylglucosamine reductase n=1 Tax=Robbsia betulipollinis TaxID=2981849 RepID=A0ABT3ZQH2_9BURK|nr:UDP-N-acetylmuramate dehydrogenase [Robbsia betulipollinis]MCY0388809.1 UDP-N-acetylmuramate dehydrogenase [Robbsia betulipollinis]